MKSEKSAFFRGRERMEDVGAMVVGMSSVDILHRNLATDALGGRLASLALSSSKSRSRRMSCSVFECRLRLQVTFTKEVAS